MIRTQPTNPEESCEGTSETKHLIFINEPPEGKFSNDPRGKVRITHGKSILPETGNGYVSIPAGKVYTVVREHVSSPDSFKQVDGNRWPTAIVETEGARGIIQLKPPITDETSFFLPEIIEEQAAMMWRQVEELDEADADQLDGLFAIWLAQATSPQDDAVGSREALLRLRGIKPKKAGNGRRGGYSHNQLQDVSKRLGHLINVEIDIGDVECYEHKPGKHKKHSIKSIKSRLVVISDTMGQRRLDGSIELERFLFRPGRVIAEFLLGPGYSTALLSIRALHYDPYRQRWEKRITRYLSWQWRIRASGGNLMQSFSVRTLLEKGCREAYTPRRKSWQQERFERMMETITDRNDLYRPANGWQYDPTSQTDLLGNDLPWIEWKVLVEPPELIPAHYKSIHTHGERFLGPVAQPDKLGEMIQRRRGEKGLNRLQAAEEIGISPALLSMIESGSRGSKPQKATRAKIDTWLKR